MSFMTVVSSFGSQVETMSSVLEQLVNKPYEHGSVLNRDRERAERFERRYDPPHFYEEERARVAARVQASSLPPLADDEEPHWPNVKYPRSTSRTSLLFGAEAEKKKSIDEVDPELLRTFEKLGVPMNERAALAGVAVDVIFDSVSVATTYKERLAKVGIIFCSISEAVRDHPDLVREYMGSVVPPGDNYYAALNSAVFTDGSFVFIPEGVKCPMELSTYFRINTENSGQFERTLYRRRRGPAVSYLRLHGTEVRFESAHAAVVELVALDRADIK